ncbi:MAG TPA: OB-fold domain-containing protein [Acidimicrobiales bacterium]|jgi:hypothetical protein|nr:OB-fold domain-containing protein [Acidimicrobiales bacterium]
MADEVKLYSADHVLEYPYVRSVGPVIGAFLTGLRDGKVVGIHGTGGKVIVPPTEYDPDTGEETKDIVDVGPEGTVTSWSWVPHPRPKHPLQTPFAWVLVKFDGADTSFLHVMGAASPDAVSTGMRVRPQFAPEGERVGHVHDIVQFVPAGGAA